MKLTMSGLSRFAVAAFALAAVSGLIYFGFNRVIAQSIPAAIQAPAAIIDIPAIVDGRATSEAVQHLSIRANDLGLYIWVQEPGGTAKIHHLSNRGIHLGTIELPTDARLTPTQEFGLDGAGNIYFVSSKDQSEGPSSLKKLSPTGELAEEYDLAGWPAAFTVSRAGEVRLLTNDGEISSAEAPTVALAKGEAPARFGAVGPPIWVPFLERKRDGSLVLVDGLSGEFELIGAQDSIGRRPIPSPLLQAALQHIGHVHGGSREEREKSAVLRSVIRSSCIDEADVLSFVLMGTRPMGGIVVIRLSGSGEARSELRLESPVDVKRADLPTDPNARLMFPQDLAIWRGTAWVLGVRGLLASYDVAAEAGRMDFK